MISKLKTAGLGLAMTAFAAGPALAEGELNIYNWGNYTNPDLIKTMNVKPPMGQGRVRLVRIGSIDLQPCGGTHVATTAEIGPLKLGKIEKKGSMNRRVSLLFAE